MIDIAELARTERDWARTDNLFMLFKEVVIDIMHSHALDDDRARSAPIRLVMYCPAGHKHVDDGEWATRPHKTHQCQYREDCDCGNNPCVCHANICGMEWRASNLPTVGVEKL